MKEKQKKLILVGAIIVVIIVVAILVVTGVLSAMNIGKNTAKETDVERIVKEGKDAIIYVENSDEKKCSNCKTIKKYLDTKNIDYEVYDSSKYSEKEYKGMLQMLTINPNDFNYPAVIYIKDGNIYADIINIKDTKVVDQFIKDYELEK